MILLDGYQEFMVGESKPLVIKVVDQDDPTTDMSAATARVTLYDSNSDAVSGMSAQSMTLTGTTTITLKKVWDTSGGGLATGPYRAVATVTFNGNIQQFEWVVFLRARPAPI